MFTVAWLQIRQITGERKLLALCLFLALPVGLSFVVRVKGGVDMWSGAQEPPTIYLFLLYPQILCELLSLLFATTILSTEIEGQTLTYLFTRPIAKWQVVVGKYLGMVAALAPLVLVSLICSWLLIKSPGGLKLIGSLGVATVGSLLAYGAIFAFFGTLLP